MRRNSFLLLLVTISCFAQQEKTITGTIKVKDATPGGVRILNLVNHKETITDNDGTFRILAKTDDLLYCSALHLDLMRHIVEADEFAKGILYIAMTAKTNQLDEVEIPRYSNIDAVSLGILDKPAKTYTPAERRLRTSRHFFIGAAQGGGVAITVDPIINYLTGRTKRMKAEVETEKFPIALKRMQEWYDAGYYDAKFGITSAESAPFEYFCIDDAEFRNAVISKKRPAADLRLVFLATAFITLQDGESVTNTKE